MKFLEIDGLRKSYGTNQVVKNFEISVERGEFVSFLGPSGCGKTTCLRMIAGFETPSHGTIKVAGKDITHLPPNERDVGMVFQSYALFPNMTVAQNVAFGLKVAKKPAAEIKTRVGEMLDLIKLPQLADRYPYQLSGGQQQRVALARAIATKPQLLLLDEPLSALDAKIRVSLREEIRSLQRALGITTIFVTHDQEEALSMSDRIVVLSEGRVEQLGTPFDIYNHPKTRFVASFVGTLNVLSGRVIDASQARVSIDGQEVKLGQLVDGDAGAVCTLALRPEAIVIGRAEGGANNLTGQIEDVSFLGAVVRIRVRFGENWVVLDTFNSPASPPPERGATVTVSFSPAGLIPLQEQRAA
ncbi:ABC transporter ATP-binding protein [Lichenihabitans psoromatis]|uniref:ABC transporter ATP-binding protein n=1 Tax=Lichenihabitans psoromatis TaxID=2528642 RepID=UPI0010368D58|nr:ABC transporter ATP-binding protein [Lichenihabitans psoromatis]